MATQTVNRVSSTITRMFSSLTIRNYRLWVVGQGISLSGTWMQTVAQGLLVLQLTGSGTALGLVTALQTIPVLLFGPWGGVVADRFPKRRILYVTQAVSAILGLLLGTLVATGAIRIEMVYLLALCLGTVSAVDNPTRQAFVMEMVGKDELVNAVSLNSTEINLARVVGPRSRASSSPQLGWRSVFSSTAFPSLPSSPCSWRCEWRNCGRHRLHLGCLVNYVRACSTSAPRRSSERFW